jgi:two-component system LytT family sensor kinase
MQKIGHTVSVQRTTEQDRMSSKGRDLLKNWINRLVCASILWTCIGLVFSLPGLGGPGGLRQALLPALVLWWSWGLLAFFIVATDQRLPFSSTQLPRRIAAHFLLSVFYTSIFVYLLAAVRALFGLEKWAILGDIHLLPRAFGGMFFWNWLIYCAIISGWLAYRYHQRYISSELRRERLERQFSEARLNALRMQLNPHFLFNALNTISSQVERSPRLARRMLEQLGDLLRLSLASKDRQEVPLAEEMQFLEHYLAIQKIRFGDHLRIEISIAPEVKLASVPSLLLQPLVENAIQHGLSRRSSGGTVTIVAIRLDDRVKIRVLDDGVGLPPGWNLQTCAGLGLAITRQRIAGLHPNGASQFAIRDREGGGTEVEVDLPFQMAEHYAVDSHDRTNDFEDVEKHP